MSPRPIVVIDTNAMSPAALADAWEVLDKSGYLCLVKQPGSCIKVINVPLWQPIDSAPRDGAIVLLWANDTLLQGRFSKLKQIWQVYESGLQCFPTHWMPRPEGPQA